MWGLTFVSALVVTYLDYRRRELSLLINLIAGFSLGFTLYYGWLAFHG